MAEHFPNLMKDINLQIQEEWSSNSINPKKVTSKQIIIKFLKTKYEENIMKETQENNILHVVEKIIRML